MKDILIKKHMDNQLKVKIYKIWCSRMKRNPKNIKVEWDYNSSYLYFSEELNRFISKGPAYSVLVKDRRWRGKNGINRGSYESYWRTLTMDQRDNEG